METVLGLIGLAVFIVCTVALAAGVTWFVVKLSPAKDTPQKQPSS